MARPAKAWDLLIKNALVFDGSGERPEVMDIATYDGRIAAKGVDLKPSQAKKVIDATGQWLMPGLLDIHTHFDLEVEVDPRLPEAVRHGTTSMVMSNCSLGVAFGKQINPDKPEENPVLDCFARVENIPKHVLATCIDKLTWNNTADYLDHFDRMPLGPNVAPMLPHSMLRIEVMGLETSIRREPTQAEMRRMTELTERAMQEGFVGFSTDALPLHYLANDPHRSICIPTQHATHNELKQLTDVVRRYDRVWQATPNPEGMGATLKNFFLTSGRLHGKPLRVTATAAIDLRTNKVGSKMMMVLSRIMNSKFMDGEFRFQTLSAPFKIYADGVTTPLMEEKASFRDLIECDEDDVEGRQRLLHDPDWVARFKHDWHVGKRGFTPARLQRKLAMEPTTFSRELRDMDIDSCPIESWSGQNLADIFQRLQTFQTSCGRNGALNKEEEEFFANCPNPIGDDADFIIHLLRQFDRKFRWVTLTANGRPEVLKKLLFHPETLPGFNDSGAHLTNMAYYDGNLRTLKMAAEDSLELVATAVKRLTRDPARLFGLDVGTLDLGAQADIVLIDPDALLQYDSEANTTKIHRDIFQQEQMVNRSDGVVKQVIIAGKVAWNGKAYTDEFGKERFGRALRYTDRNSPPYLSHRKLYRQEETASVA